MTSVRRMTATDRRQRIVRAAGELFIVRGYTVHIEDVRDTNLTRADARKGPFDQVGVVPPRR
ncbi:hypothetical protein [Streptomyces sp. enrichment culture]|uniref:hypothetical protein n=1 Tax=Streptomyces sp. enrichment culture TaxID=1795815 RepID=UPI003F559CD5